MDTFIGFSFYTELITMHNENALGGAINFNRV